MLTDIKNHIKISISDFSGDFIIALIATIILATIIKSIYQLCLSENTYSDLQFANSTFLVTICTYVIVYIVKESITLSLGLVGALSIIRFRTPIKDPFELSIFFVSIAIGISNAVFQYLPSILLTIIVIIFLLYLKLSSNGSLILSKLKVKNKKLKSYILEINSNNNFSIKSIFEKLKILENSKIISLSKVDNENNLSLQLSLNGKSELDHVKSKLDEIKDINYHINEN